MSRANSDLATKLVRKVEELHRMSVREGRRELLPISGHETELLPERARPSREQPGIRSALSHGLGKGEKCQT